MADYRAISGVSATLRRLLLDRMERVDAAVTLVPPDISPPNINGPRVNVYLYHVSENGYLKNQEIPGHGHAGTYGHPPLSLDLRYVLTAYPTSEEAADSDLVAQEIMGDAMRVLHDFAIVRETLAAQRTVGGTLAGDPILDVTLLNQFEQVKITLEPTGMEEFSKLWTALPQANFRRSAMYLASAVQIESQSERRVALPVTTRRIYMTARIRPEVRAVYRTPAAPADPQDTRAAVGENITIEGANFIADATFVRVGAADPVAVAPLDSGTIRVNVPNDARLAPGPQAVQVIVERAQERVEGGLDHGTVVAAPGRIESNFAVFLLVPRVTSVAPAAGNAAALLTVTGSRLYARGRASAVLIGDVSIDVREPAPGDPWVMPADTSVQVPLTAIGAATPPLTPATYAVRVISNGAQSRDDGVTFQVV